MKTLQLDVQVFEDGILGAKIKTDLAPGRYQAVLVLGDRRPEQPATTQDDLMPLAEFVEKARRDHIARALARCDGNRSQAARELGVDPRTVFRFLADGEEKDDKP